MPVSVASQRAGEARKALKPRTSGISGTGAELKASIAGRQAGGRVLTGRWRAAGGEARCVDVRETLAALERRLDELETELVADGHVVHDGYRIVIEALADIHALSALERALGESVELQAYAGGWASLVVDVS